MIVSPPSTCRKPRIGSPKSKPAASNTLRDHHFLYNKRLETHTIKKQNIYPAVNMPVTHVVMFKFKNDVPPKEIKAIVNRMLDLKNQCLHPGTSRPYIISLKGGRENSIEGLQNSATHIFTMDFQTSEDRDYYVRADPAHLLFLQSIGSVVDKVQVVDFASGVW